MALLQQSPGISGPLIFVGLCQAGIMLHVPGIFLVAMGSIIFGWEMGCILGWIGAVAGSVSSFLIARFFIQKTLQQTLFSRFKSMQQIDQHLVIKGFQTILALRLFLFLAPPLNWAVGLTRVRFAHYLLGTALGIIPGLVVTSYAAASFSRMDSQSSVFYYELLVPLSLVIVLTATSWIIARRLLK
jgi:uncharacterized membrane protein YdjX (TVP38/TMEM64 family)